MDDFAIDLSRVALKQRRTRIVATVGPASNTPETLASLLEAGVDVFRLNFSHGTHEGHAAIFQAIRAASAKVGRPVAVLADLCGPKIRVGRFEGGGIDLAWGEEVTVTTRDVQGKPGLIPSEYRALAADVEPGNRILLDDGKLELEVRAVDREGDVRCVVLRGGRLTDRKGMNLPGVRISTPSLTDKDRADATFAVGTLGVDYLAMSFVRAASDVAQLKAHLADLGADTPVIAKIEKPEALGAIGAILEQADGIMVARGDLGVEMPAEEVPLIQQELIRLAKLAQKPVIVATQMLESMIESARPTRAEVTDVASAARSLADAVMLSAETASGKYPRDAVATMDRVLRLVEGYQWKHGQYGTVSAEERDGHSNRLAVALSRATSMLSGELDVRAVVAPTRSGRMVQLISSARPAAPIVALTSSEKLQRRLKLLWGVSPELATAVELEAPAPLARVSVRRLGVAETGHHILLVWDASPDRSGLAPTVSILTV